MSLFGFLIGLMVGRLLQPDPARLERIESTTKGLDLWFNVAPNLRAEPFDGAFILRIETFGREQQGQLQLDGKAVNWGLKREGRDMLLRFVAARGLRGAWRGEALEEGWRLSVGLDEAIKQ